LLPTGSSEKEAKCSEAPTVLLETSSADRKRNEKEMKERTIRFFTICLFAMLQLQSVLLKCYLALHIGYTVHCLFICTPICQSVRHLYTAAYRETRIAVIYSLKWHTDQHYSHYYSYFIGKTHNRRA